jgi:hypothetical protein
VEPLPLRYALTATELARAQVAHTPASKVSARSTRLLGLACLVPALVYLLTQPGASNAPAAMAPLAIGILLVGLSTPFSLRRRVAWVFSRAPGLLEPVTLLADETGVRATSETSEQWFAWSRYQAVHDTLDGVVLIVRGGASIRWVPARAFTGREQQAAWHEALERWRSEAAPAVPTT